MTTTGASPDDDRVAAVPVPVRLYAPPPVVKEATVSAVEVGPRERAILIPEARSLAERIAEPTQKAAYAALLDGLSAGMVDGAAIEPLENLLDLGLQTGRFRRQHGPEGAILLNRLSHRTPRGQAVAAALTGVNQAWSELAGQALESLTIRATTPGAYEMTVETDRCQMTVAIDPSGVRLASLETGV